MDLFGRAYWPGAESCVSCTYTTSHGISPGVAVFTMNPQAISPAEVGDLIFDDNYTRIVVPRCKVDRLQVRIEDGGEVWDLVILDRRWRWRELGAISGVYNQLKPNGDIIPWTSKTPKELAELCLRAMGEARYEIRLPAVPVNPPVSWNYVPPAQALSALVESLGCRVIYRLHRDGTDSVLIAPPGEGDALPTGSVPRDGPTLDSPERPDRIVIVGQPVRFQARFKLEAVGEDWNGEIKRIEELSYAPAGPDVNVAHEVEVSPVVGTVAVGNRFTVDLDDGDNAHSFSYVAAVASVADVVTGLKAAIDAAPDLPWTATATATTLTIKGAETGEPFDVVASAAENGGGGTPQITWEVTVQGRQIGENPWLYCPPPAFGSAQETERLSRLQAIELARKCVFRYYRITADASGTDEAGPLRIPDYDEPIIRREQIVLHQTRAAPIEPTEPDDAQLDDQGRRRRILFYNGHTVDKPAVCYGSYFHGTSGENNTRPETEVAVDFSIDTQRQLVIFSQYVFYYSAGKVSPAELVLETGCNVRDHQTNAMLTLEGFADLGPPVYNTPPLYVLRDDVQAAVLGVYDEQNRLQGAVTDYPDARARITHYLTAYAAQYRNVVNQDRAYNGLVFIPLDGAIQQVTWSVGEQGCETQASRNTEHSKYIPPYPVRKKNEAMDAVGKGAKRTGAQVPFTSPGIESMHAPPPSQSSPSRGGPVL